MGIVELESGLFLIWSLYAGLCPWTKVEESFNVQAVHDILIHGNNLSQYDHHQFPGVVPRTFVGPLALSSLALIPSYITSAYGMPKDFLLNAIRMILGFFCLLSFKALTKSIQKFYGSSSSVRTWFILITAAQFHYNFYVTRPLPNIFALVLVQYAVAEWLISHVYSAAAIATLSVVLFRSELVLLYGPLFLPSLLMSRQRFIRTLSVGLLTAAVSLAISVPLDSMFWGYWVWPEGQVWWFNVVQNKSHQWGTMPFLWYFYSALPRALGLSFLTAVAACFYSKKALKVFLPAIAFVFLYSFLPHKELRFIIYVIPLFNIASAEFAASLWNRQSVGKLRHVFKLIPLGMLAVSLATSALFLQASRWNYPGGDALYRLNQMGDPGRQLRIHIDPHTAMNGVSLFHNIHPLWKYNKSESINYTTPALWREFDFAFVGTSDDEDLETVLNQRYLLPPETAVEGGGEKSRRFEVLHRQATFAGIRRPEPIWHFWNFRLKYRNCTAVLMVK